MRSKEKRIDVPYQSLRRTITLPKDRSTTLNIKPPYLENDREYFKLMTSLMASKALVDMLVNNQYPNDRVKMLRYFKSKVSRLRYNIDQFLKTYKESGDNVG